MTFQGAWPNIPQGLGAGKGFPTTSRHPGRVGISAPRLPMGWGQPGMGWGGDGGPFLGSGGVFGDGSTLCQGWGWPFRGLGRHFGGAARGWGVGALGAEESLGVLAACVRGWGGPLGTQVGPLWVLGGSFGCAGNLGVSR